MNIARFSIKRPIFITSLVLLMLLTGYVSLNRLGVDLFPDVTFPVVSVTTPYPGAGPEEVEEQISKPLEEEIGSISGLDKISSINQEGVSIVVAEFTLETNIKYAEDQVRDKVSQAKVDFPDDAEESLISRIDPADNAIVRLALFADLPPAKLYDIANEELKPRLEQVAGVSQLDILGGTRREIQVEMDRNKLNRYEIPAVNIAKQIQSTGVNVPVGKHQGQQKEMSYRTVARYESLDRIRNTMVSFGGDISNAVLVKDLATVIDGTEEPKNLAFYFGPKEFKMKGEKEEEKKPKSVERVLKPALYLDVFKQSGQNTVAVADGVIERVAEINKELQGKEGAPQLRIIRDGSVWIRYNIEDVTLAIILGIILAVVVVYFFLGNVRSTIITGLALPNSLLGAFIIMYIMGFTINVMSLLALSLCVGLLVDDAIVVRENIFRKLEEGHSPMKAAELGTVQVALAVVGTSLTVIAVFFPIGFLSGITGQFFKQFGLTVVFAMIISLFDGLTVAPMLSAYFAGKTESKPNWVIRQFDRFQNWLEHIYGLTMDFALAHPLIILFITFLIFAGSIFSAKFIKKTFLPPNDQGEFIVSLDLTPGTSLYGTKEAAMEVLDEIKKVKELDYVSVVVGDKNGQDNLAYLGVQLVPPDERNVTTTDVKNKFRKILKKFEDYRPSVNDYSAVGGGIQYPFQLNIRGENLEELDAYAQKLITKFEAQIPDLTDLDTDFRSGKPEFQIELQPNRLQYVGVLPGVAGQELRYHIEGGEVGKFYENGIEYDVRLRLKPEQRQLERTYAETKVPNIANKLVPISAISIAKNAEGPAKINRQNRSRVVRIQANLTPNGAIGNAMELANKIMAENPPPPGSDYEFVGQGERFKELITNIISAFGMALIFIYLVLSSLYESFITPITILFAIPPAISGAFYALAITGEMLNLFSMIGMILLMGLVAKNSILLVDYALQAIREGQDQKTAIYNAGRTRLRPILMTSLAMIAGTVPIAMGIGEASKSRTAMGVGIIGGLILSTLVTLIVVPAIFEFIDNFREKVESFFRPDYSKEEDETLLPENARAEIQKVKDKQAELERQQSAALSDSEDSSDEYSNGGSNGSARKKSKAKSTKTKK